MLIFKNDFKKSGSQFMYSERELSAIVTTPLIFKSRQDPDFNNYAKEWCLYFSPQHREFSYFDETTSISKYDEIVEQCFGNSDPVDIAITRKTSHIQEIHIVDNEPDNEQVEIQDNNLIEEITDYDEDFIDQNFEIVEDNIKILNPQQVSNLKNSFQRIIEEELAISTTLGYIERLSAQQREAFDKIVDPINKNIVLLGKAGTGNFQI